MAGLFKTGEELRRERMQELATTNRKIAQQSATTPREAGNLAIGSQLGTLLVGAFASDEGIGAGDVEQDLLEAGVNPKTAEGLIQIQQGLYDAGFGKQAAAMDKVIKARLDIERSFAEKEGRGGGGKPPPVTAADREYVAGAVLSRAGNPYFEDSKIAEVLAPMYQEGATPSQRAQGRTLDTAIAEQANMVAHKLQGMGVGGVSREVVVDKMLDMIEASPEIINPKTGFLFWRKDGFIDTPRLNKALSQFGTRIIQAAERAKEAKAAPPAPEDEVEGPVQEPGEPVTSTQYEEPPEPEEEELPPQTQAERKSALLKAKKVLEDKLSKIPAQATVAALDERIARLKEQGLPTEGLERAKSTILESAVMTQREKAMRQSLKVINQRLGIE